MENQVDYYTKTPGSPVLKPANKEAQQKALADVIFSLLMDNDIPSFMARDILGEVKARVIAYQGVMDRNYYQQ